VPEKKAKASLQQTSQKKPIDIILQLLFPERCLLCGSLLKFETAKPLCYSCIENDLPTGSVCPHCGSGSCSGSKGCFCTVPGASLQDLFALCHYEGHWRTLIHDLKYRGRRNLSRPFGCWLAREIVNHDYCCPQVVVPVPLHYRRERERGYNQSALIAIHVSRQLGVTYGNLLIRTRETESQTKISRRERQENVKGAFACNSSSLSGTMVLLIDDVFSTGATMKEAAKVLGRKGALVYGAVVAYNPPKADR
jgi:competence protein ComFC